MWPPKFFFTFKTVIMLAKFSPQKKLRSPCPGPSGAYWSSGPWPSSNCRHSPCLALPRSQGTFGTWPNLPEATTTFSTPGASNLPGGKPGSRGNHTTVWLLATQLVPHEGWVICRRHWDGMKMTHLERESSILSCARVESLSLSCSSAIFYPLM